MIISFRFRFYLGFLYINLSSAVYVIIRLSSLFTSEVIFCVSVFSEDSLLRDFERYTKSQVTNNDPF